MRRSTMMTEPGEWPVETFAALIAQKAAEHQHTLDSEASGALAALRQAVMAQADAIRQQNALNRPGALGKLCGELAPATMQSLNFYRNILQQVLQEEKLLNTSDFGHWQEAFMQHAPLCT